jgi:hypothetical protein
LIGGLGELIVDSQDRLSLGDDQSGEVDGEMAALGFVGQEIVVLTQGVLNDRWEFNDLRYNHMLKLPECAMAISVRKWSAFSCFNKCAMQISVRKWSAFSCFDSFGEQFAKLR